MLRAIRRAFMHFSMGLIIAAHTARFMLRRALSSESTEGVRVILERDGKVVLVKHWYAPGVWTLPGGGRKSHEAPEAAAKREAQEETGYTITSISGKVGAYEGQLGARDITHVYYSTDFLGGLRHIPDMEIMQRELFSLTDLPDTLSPVSRSHIEAYLQTVHRGSTKAQ